MAPGQKLVDSTTPSPRPSQRSVGAPGATTKWAEGFASPTSTGSHDESGVSINSHYDSGNIEVVDISPEGDIELRIHEDPFCESDGRAHFQWFHYRVTGARHQELRMRLVNAGEASYPSAWKGYRACASYDRRQWFRVDTDYEEAAGVLTIKHRPERDAVYYAYFAPYPYEQHNNLVAELQNMEGVTLENLGETLDGHDLDLVRIGEPGPGKRKVWVIARQHPGESMAEWFAEGLLRRLLNPSDLLAKSALHQAVFYVVPNMCPDGTWRGHLRTNAAGANLNREWASPSPQRSPEVLLVRDRMDAVGCDLMIDVHGDEELPYNFIAGNEGIPAWDDRLAQLQHQFTEAFKEASHEFQTEHGYGVDAPGQANMTTASSAVGQRYNCLAFTLEMPFKDVENWPSPAEGWSPRRAMKLGATILDPIHFIIPKLR